MHNNFLESLFIKTIHIIKKTHKDYRKASKPHVRDIDTSMKTSDLYISNGKEMSILVLKTKSSFLILYG